MVPRDYARIYDVLRKIGHTGTDEDVAQRIIAVARQATIPVEVVCHDYTCTEPHQRRAHGTCAIVGDIIRTGRSALILPDTGAACESDADCLRVYDLLRKVGHAGTEDEIAERMIAAAPRASLRPDAIAENYPCSAAFGSPEWRCNRAKIVSCIVGLTTQIGRTAVLMPDAGAVPDGNGVAEDPDEDATSETVAEVVAAVRNCDWQGRIDVVEDILSYMGSDVGEEAAAVKELLEDESEDVRLHAFYALCHLGVDAEAVVPTLTEHLRGGDESLRDKALQTFFNCRNYVNPELVPDFLEILTDPASDHHVRCMAAGCLRFCGADAEPAVSALTRGLTDDDYSVRVHSALALAAIGRGAKAALPALVKVRRSDIHQDAVHALRSLGPDAQEAVPVLIDGLMEGDLDHRNDDATILASIGPAAREAVPALLEAFPALRDNAVQALGSIGPAAREAAPALLEALPALRGTAFEALKSIGAAAEEIAPVLVHMSQSEHSYDRRFAAEALVEIGAETDVAVAVLIDSLNDDNSRTRYLAARTVGEIGPRAKSAVPALSAALNDENTRVRDAAKAALERIVPVAAG